MIEYPDGYRPIDAATTLWTRFNVSLPNFVDPRQIGVNTRGIEKLCRIGGINHLRVISKDDGETSQFVPTVVGFSQNGEALAGKIGVKHDASTFDANSERQRSASKYLPHAATQINTTVELNTAEITNRIQDDPKWKDGVRSTEAWANYIDHDVKKALTEAGIKHLIYGFNKYNAGEFAFQYGLMGLFEALNGHISLESILTRLLIVPPVLNTMAYVRAIEAGRGNDFRISAFYGPQLDRALILKVVSLKTTLVKEISAKNQKSSIL